MSDDLPVQSTKARHADADFKETSAHDASADEWQRLSRGKDVYWAVRREIGQLSLAPGTTLNEAELSVRYATSRTPIREALLRLEQDGLLQRVGRKLKVRQFEFSEIEDLYQIREALEKMAVRLCIERATEAELDALKEQILRYGHVHHHQPYERYVEFANDFHWSLARLSGNALLLAQLIEVSEKVNIITLRYMQQLPATHAEVEHLSILQAISDRDVVVAEAAVRAHIQKVIKTLRRQGTQTEPDRPFTPAVFDA